MKKPAHRNSRRLRLRLPLLLLVFGAFQAPAFARDYAQATVETLAVTSTNYAGQPLEYPRSGTPEVTALLVHLPPGSSTGWHQHPVPVYAWMLEGEITIRTESGVVKTFVKGEPIIEVMNLLHNGTNTGKETASLAVFYTGLKGVPNVIKASAPDAATENSR
ncbi:MAG: cupin domain-containing protein [Chlorobiaceae bacterium]|nr:cupin domain-containing protein [Chlorobiaceae bacterium]